MAHLRVVLAGLVASTALATADTPKRQTLTVDVKLSTRVKPKERVAVPAPAPVSADRIIEIEFLTSPIRAEQEQILINLLVATPDADVDEKSELYFRLGELYAKQARLFRLQSVELELKKNLPASKRAAATARSYLAKAAVTYKSLTETTAFQNFKRMDLALFVYAYTLQAGTYYTQARAVYDKLLKNYPASKYVAEAHLAFAEYYFEAGQLVDAQERYKLVLKSPQSNVYWYAMYKLGWIQLNRRRHDEALETFFQVAKATETEPKHAVLNRSAKKDFVRAYSEVGKVDKALVAFKRVANAGAFDMFETLAGFYMEQGKSDKAIYAFRELMKLSPRHANVCQWQYEVAHSMLTLPGATNVDKVREIVDLNRLYTALAGKQVLPAAQATDCRDNAAAMSGELARAYHNEYAKTYSNESFVAANQLYATYLATFPTATDAPMSAYYRADLLWARAEREKDARLQAELWEQTAVAFTELVTTGKLDPKRQNEAAFAAVQAYLAAHDSDPRAAAPVAEATAGAPQPIPQREQRMLAAFDLYLARTRSPPEDELVQMKLLKANVLRRFDHLTEAIPLFKEIMARHPDHPAADDAAMLLVDVYIRQNNEAALLALAEQMLADTKLLADHPELEKKLDRITVVALRNRAQAIEARAKKSGDLAEYVKCGLAFLDIYNRNPEDGTNDEVLWNAGVCFEQGRSLQTAIRMFDMLERFYPKSKLTAKSILRAGKAYADMAFYAEAAKKLEQYAKRYAGEQDAYDAMNDAVFYFKGIGHDDKAIEDTQYFVRTFGARKPAEAAEAAFALTAIYEKRGDDDAVVKHLREYVRVHGSRGGSAKLVTAYSKLGQVLFRRSCASKTVDGACIKVSRERAVASRANAQATRGLRTQCGPDSKIKLTVMPRDARAVRAAQEAFAAALREYAKVSPSTPEYGMARHHAAQAKLADATVELEAYFTLAFPTNLDFSAQRPAVARKSMTRFDAWLGGKEAAGRRAAEKFSQVLSLKDNASSIAAAARIGQISQHFADALFTAEIPRDLRSGPYAEDQIESYCDVLTEKADPLALRALDAYGVCLSKSTELGWFSEWSKLCERELGQIRPELYPTASERRSDPALVASVIALEAAPKVD